MIESTASILALQPIQMPQFKPSAASDTIVPRDPNAPAGPRPSFDVTPMERLRETRAIAASDGPQAASLSRSADPSADDREDPAGAGAVAISSTPEPPAKGTAMDLRA